MNFKIIMLSERSQTKKYILYGYISIKFQKKKKKCWIRQKAISGCQEKGFGGGWGWGRNERKGL